MEEIDIALNSLREICETYKDFCKNHDHITEADTRINIIDKILSKVLLWPDNDIAREQNSESGYSDYLLKINGKNFVCVEAKKEGKTFLLPQDKNRKYYKINGALTTDLNIREALFQVRAYCDDLAIRYAIITNGNTWIIFRAIREDIPWKEGSARVFSSLEDIENNFTEFWNLLSYPCINAGSLDTEFSNTVTSNRISLRVLDSLLQPNVPLLRNSLHTELTPIIKLFFEDIADPNYIDTLENCYVYSTTVKNVSDDINFVIKDAIPKFLADENTVEIKHGDKDAGVFGRVIEKAVKQTNGQLFLLLGGIGSGKTTFQKRYQLTVGKEVLNSYSIWFSLDFLKPPSDQAQLEQFVWQTLLDQLRNKYQSPYLETRQNIKRIYKNEINALEQTALYGLVPNTKDYESILNSHLARWQENLSEYVPKLLSIAKPKRDLTVVLFFDNVDQLSPLYQSQIFLLAQRVTDKVKSTTIIALREESYFTASVQRVFTAYINRKFHIASPPFRKMIDQRIKYALKIIDDNNENTPISGKFTQLSQLQQRSDISDFLNIVEHSIFERNRNIARFIDHLCFGNMRVALQMFSTFLVSGVTDVEKMIRIYRRDGIYYVSFHEFLRSIMLGERFYYKESQSDVMNLFNCGAEKNSSHFTSLRILHVLDIHRTESNKEGEGFYEINNISSIFEDIFNNREDFIKTINRLINRQLVETNTKNSESISGSTHVRITSAGWYYLKHLVSSFAYLDLVLQDTPINNNIVHRELVESVKRVNNSADHEENKLMRMEVRFSRVNNFLKYLENEEIDEQQKFHMQNKNGVIYIDFIKNIIQSVNDQKDYILNKIKSNKEKYEDLSTPMKSFFNNEFDEEEQE